MAKKSDISVRVNIGKGLIVSGGTDVPTDEVINIMAGTLFAEDVEAGRELVKQLFSAEIHAYDEEYKKNLAARLTQTNAAISPISNELCKAIAYKRSPSLFDTDEIRNRDKALSEQNRARVSLQRNFKPVVLTHVQHRVVTYLQMQLGFEAYKCNGEVVERYRAPKSDVTMKGTANIVKEIPYTMRVHIPTASKYIFGRNKQEQRRQVVDALLQLGATMQCVVREIPCASGGKAVITRWQPLIKIHEGGELHIFDSEGNRLTESYAFSYMDVELSQSFFQDLDKRYCLITPLLLQVWQTPGHQNELYGVLQAHLLSIFYQFKVATKNALTKLEKDETYMASSPEMQQVMRDDTITQHMTFRMSTANLKERLTTQYDSSRAMKAKFLKNLKAALKGYANFGLIKSGSVVRNNIVILLNFYYLRDEPTKELS